MRFTRLSSLPPSARGPSRATRRGLLVLFFLALVAPIGCSGKPKYPACGGDKDCKEGEHCINKQCLQCGDDSHCKPGEECKEGGCVAKKDDAEPTEDNDPRKKCKVDEDCEDDEDCVDGRCSRPWQGEQPEGLTCQLRPVFFGFDQSTIADEARDGLGKTADCIKEAGARGVYLAGYTDSRGTEEYNIALSERRAQTVADYLARLGIDPARFRVIPKGETESTGTDESSYQQDRRVDLEWR